MDVLMMMIEICLDLLILSLVSGGHSHIWWQVRSHWRWLLLLLLVLPVIIYSLLSISLQLVRLLKLLNLLVITNKICLWNIRLILILIHISLSNGWWASSGWSTHTQLTRCLSTPYLIRLIPQSILHLHLLLLSYRELLSTEHGCLEHLNLVISLALIILARRLLLNLRIYLLIPRHLGGILKLRLQLLWLRSQVSSPCDLPISSHLQIIPGPKIDITKILLLAATVYWLLAILTLIKVRAHSTLWLLRIRSLTVVCGSDIRGPILIAWWILTIIILLLLIVIHHLYLDSEKLLLILNKD